VVCFSRACPFLMAWSTVFFLLTISSFRDYGEREREEVNLQNTGETLLTRSES